ncbi:MAG: hypothetical protein AMS16_07360, partial [Planctomycetes bacterium DG_58]
MVASLADRIRRRIPSVAFKRGRVRADWIGYTARVEGMEVLMYARDFRSNGVNRCGLALRTNPRRVSPCLRPFTDVYVDYDGSVMPCCNLRSDYPQHVPAVLGKLDASPGAVFRVFSGEKAVRWRKGLVGFSPKPYPCDDCSFDIVPDTPPNRRRVKRV